MNLRKLTITKVVIITLSLMLNGCKPATSSATPVTEEPKETDAPSTEIEPSATPLPDPISIRVDIGGQPSTLDPALVAPLEAASQDMVANLFITLTQRNPDSGTVQPEMADRWEQSEDGLTWTVYLRDDVFWERINAETGEIEQIRPVTSSDVVFTVQRVCQNKTASPLVASLFLIQGCREIYSLPAEGITPEILNQTIGVRVLNDTVVEFKLTQNGAIFPTLLSTPILTPVPADLLETTGDTWTQPDTIWTSGPYLLQPTIPVEEGYTLIASQSWPLERSGNVDVVQISLNDDPDQAYQAWNDGLLAMASIPPDQIAATPFGDDPRFWLHALPAAMIIVPSYDTPPMEQAGLRQALALSLDRQSLIDAVLEPAGFAALPASSLIPPGMIGAPSYGTVGSTFDPEAARVALSEAGFPNCLGMPAITLLTDTSDASLAIANNIADQWRSTLGCSEETIVVEQRSLQEVLIALHEPPTPIQRQFRPLRPGAIILNWQADYPDAQHWLADIVGCREDFPRAYLNSARPCVAADDDLLRAAGIHDLTNRAAVYSRVEDAFFGPGGEMPLIPVYFYARPLAFQPWVEFAPLHAGPLRFDEWRIDPAQNP